MVGKSEFDTSRHYTISIALANYFRDDWILHAGEPSLSAVEHGLGEAVCRTVLYSNTSIQMALNGTAPWPW